MSIFEVYTGTMIRLLIKIAKIGFISLFIQGRYFCLQINTERIGLINVFFSLQMHECVYVYLLICPQLGHRSDTARASDFSLLHVTYILCMYDVLHDYRLKKK